MPRVLLAVLCDDVRQELGGKVSLMGIFARFNVADFTQPMPSFHVFAKMGFEAPGDYPIDVELRSSEGQRIFQLQGMTHVEAQEQTTNLYVANLDLGMGNLKLPRPGGYEFALRCNNQEIGLVPFDAVVVTPALVQ